MSDSVISDKAAIAAALEQDWKEAIRINLSLLKTDKQNINVLNRLGFAYMQSGQLTAAKKTFLKVTKLDTYNQIAVKNLKKLVNVRQKDILKTPKHQVSPMFFLEEPGKTKIVECVNAAPIALLSTVSPGEEIVLHARNHAVEVRNFQNTYLAALPDDLSFRLIKFLAGGNTYQALIKSVGKNTLTVFLRELSRGKRFHNQPSFASTGIYMPFSGNEHAGVTETDDEQAAGTEE
jgi:tetratricopeptide (TPR) repeat protein